MKDCPLCKEEIQDDAVVCKHCGARETSTGWVVAGVGSKTSGLAVASLVFGIFWIWGLGSILALVFGYGAKRQINNSNGTRTGKGMAITGIVLGWLGVAFIATMFLAWGFQ